jgi:hypothetical protein
MPIREIFQTDFISRDPLLGNSPSAFLRSDMNVPRDGLADIANGDAVD